MGFQGSGYLPKPRINWLDMQKYWRILNNPLIILLVAVPLIIQSYFVFFLT